MRGIVYGFVGAVLLLMSGAGCQGTYAVGAGYDYDYYPNSEVYYSPVVHEYYWRDHDDWHHGGNIPANLHLENDHAVRVHLNTDKPYTMHEQVRSQHPGVVAEERH